MENVVYVLYERYGLNFEDDNYNILGIYDSMQKANKAKIAYKRSRRYKNVQNGGWDYFDIGIDDVNLNKNCWPKWH